MISVSLRVDKDMDMAKLEAWMARLLQEQGESIYRMKGVVALAGEERKFVMQSVHCMFNGDFGMEWAGMQGAAARSSRLVFIGQDLDEEALRAGFEQCVATTHK